MDGTERCSPANEVVARDQGKAGGEAIANGDDVSDWNGAKAMIDQAIDTFGKLDILINNAGILRDRMLINMDRGRMGRGDQGASEGHLRADAARRRLLARPGKKPAGR